jgi:hypothetical protein
LYYNSGMSNLVYFRQGAPAYTNDILGYNPAERDKKGQLIWTLGNYGCLVTALAMFVATVTGDKSWTPGRMNKFLQDNGGFEPGGGLLYWSAISRLFPFIETQGVSRFVENTNKFLQDEPNYALIKLNDGAHYAFAPMVGKMIDPIDGKLKNLAAGYKFSEARLFRFVGGKGSAAPASAPATISTSTSVGESPMTDQQEQQAYQIVLGRNREGAASGRTAMQFILDAQGELSQQRTGIQRTVEELKRQAQTYETEAGDLRAKLTAATAEEWQKTYRADKRRLVAKKDALITDLAQVQPDYFLHQGMIVRQAGTFLKDGVVYARSQNSVDRGDWYGYPLDSDLFDLNLSTPDPDLNDRLQAKTAEAYGVVERVKEAFKAMFKKESK